MVLAIERCISINVKWHGWYPISRMRRAHQLSQLSLLSWISLPPSLDNRQRHPSHQRGSVLPRRRDLDSKIDPRNLCHPPREMPVFVENDRDPRVGVSIVAIPRASAKSTRQPVRGISWHTRIYDRRCSSNHQPTWSGPRSNCSKKIHDSLRN